MDLWLVDPVTQAYKTCLETGAAKIGRQLGEGEFNDSSNNDLSMNQINCAIGQKLTLEGMAKFSDILHRANMIKWTKEQLEANKEFMRKHLPDEEPKNES